jgi:hypothetical protein
MYKMSLIIIALGSLIFLVAAFMPISKVFVERSSQKKLEIITSNRTTWNVMQVLFGLGALVAAIGVGVLAYAFQPHQESGLLKLSSLLLIIGSLLWIWHLYLRGTNPEGFAFGQQPWWHFAGYTIITQVAMVIAGYYFLQTPYPNWIGYTLIISMGVLFLLTVIFKDMPPFVYYVFFIVAVIGLWRNSGVLEATAVGA